MKKIITMALAVATLLVGAASSRAAVVKLSLNDIVPGSETTTLVTNGDFEDNSSGNGFQPAGWGRFGNMFYDTPSYTVPNDSSQVANFHIDGGGVGNYNQIVDLLPNTEYVLSAYMWHLGDSGRTTSRTELDLNDASGEPDDGGGSMRVSQADADANTGYFVYGTFNTADTGTSVQVRPFFVTESDPTTGWPNQPDGGLWDNIAITLASSFSAPVPEPTTLALSLLGLVVYYSRRKR